MRYLLLTYLSLIVGSLSAQVINSIAVSHDTIRLGDEINVYHRLTVPPGTSITSVDYTIMMDSLKSRSMVTGALETADAEWKGRFMTFNNNVIPLRDLKSMQPGTYLDTFRLTIYDPGLCTLHPPALAMDTTSQDVSVMNLQHPTVLVSVTQRFADVIEANKDSMSLEVLKRELSPLRDNIYTPMTLKDQLWKWAIPLLLLILALGYYIYRKTRPEEEEVVLIDKPTAPAHYHALKSLEMIREDELWKKGQEKQYHSDLTHTIRQYLEDRFDINALESTTMEIKSELGDNLTLPQQTELNQILQISDLVKFAKAQTTDDLNENFLRRAQTLVEETLQANLDFNEQEYLSQRSAYEAQQRNLS